MRAPGAIPQLQLSIFTALSLEVPRAAGDLERRFLEPFARRMFEGVPPLDYLRELRAGRLPANVELNEFYFRPGAMLGVPAAQQGYISSNYTHAARDMLARGVNAVLVMVAERGGRYSLSSNPDLTLDVVAGMRARAARPARSPGMVNRKLPFMTGDAEVGEDYFDVLVDAPRLEHRLFGVPNPAVDPPDHAIGLHAAALVKDGGTLQLGIGSLGDSVAHWLRVRHEQPAGVRRGGRGARPGPLARADRARRRPRPLRRGSLRLQRDVHLGPDGALPRGRDPAPRRRDGHVLQAAFFLGPEAFYQALRDLPEDERRLFRMTSVARINDIFGEEDGARRRLRDARFINICMKATLFGAVASDGLEDGRVVSGVGGQYNFVAMAHELAGARSILLLRATREAGGETESNIVFNYGHATIPRHLRDIVVTEYGIADLRGRTDAEVAGALIAIADRRFQDALAARAIAAGKLPRGWRVPEAARGNTPQALAARLAPLGGQGLLPTFPLGTDFDAAEQQLVPALRWLKENASHWRGRGAIALGLATARAGARDTPALERMGLATPRSLRERLLRRMVVLSLQRTTS